MHNTLSKDREWSVIEGLICEVTRFEPFATCENGRVTSSDRTMPYALVALECRDRVNKLPPDTTGAIRHKLDFKNLWAAFIERGVADDEKVTILWSKKNLNAPTKLFAPFMPRLAVVIFKAEALKLLTNSGYRPEIRGEARLMAELPLRRWQPKVWKDPVVPTLYEHYVSEYMLTGDEKYLHLIEGYE